MDKRKSIEIIVDTRESRPVDFSMLKFVDGTIRKKMEFADYTTEKLKNLVVIERKTKTDLFGTLGRNRKRFLAELDRAYEAGVKFFYIVIEEELSEIYVGNFIRKGGKTIMTMPYGANIIAQLLSFSMKHKLNVIPIFAGDKRTSAKIIKDILVKAEVYFGGNSVDS